MAILWFNFRFLPDYLNSRLTYRDLDHFDSTTFHASLQSLFISDTSLKTLNHLEFCSTVSLSSNLAGFFRLTFGSSEFLILPVLTLVLVLCTFVHFKTITHFQSEWHWLLLRSLIVIIVTFQLLLRNLFFLFNNLNSVFTIILFFLYLF